MFSRILIITLALFANSGFAEKCPTAPLQDPELASYFNIDQFLGHYYELSLHDYTQPTICGCTTSNKTLEDNDVVIDDAFLMICPKPSINPKGKIYPSALSFNRTDAPGVFEGYWPVVPGTIIPDYVVAVGQPDTPGDPYRWALEFQCVEELGSTIFVGVNFYARDTMDTDEGVRSESEMDAAAQEYGVYNWTGGQEGMRYVEQTGCPGTV